MAKKKFTTTVTAVEEEGTFRLAVDETYERRDIRDSYVKIYWMNEETVTFYPEPCGRDESSTYTHEEFRKHYKPGRYMIPNIRDVSR